LDAVDGAMAVHQLHIAGDRRKTRPQPKPRHREGKKTGCVLVVGVEEADEAAGRVAQAEIAGGGWSRVPGLRQQAYRSRICRRDRFDFAAESSVEASSTTKISTSRTPGLRCARAEPMAASM